MITASVTPLIPRDLVGRLAQPIFGAMRTKGRRDSVDKRWKQQGSGNESESLDEWGQAMAAVGVSKEANGTMLI
jgi:pyrroloquinoline quinone (PQQ) biosynthesis protein C